MAFFLIQGLAVAATRRVRPRGWRRSPWVAGTFAFNLASSALFFASLDEVLPFYMRLPVRIIAACRRRRTFPVIGVIGWIAVGLPSGIVPERRLQGIQVGPEDVPAAGDSSGRL